MIYTVTLNPSLDRIIDIDELYKYVYRKVTQTAAHFPLPQTPVRMIRADVEGVPGFLHARLRARSRDRDSAPARAFRIGLRR